MAAMDFAFWVSVAVGTIKNLQQTKLFVETLGSWVNLAPMMKNATQSQIHDVWRNVGVLSNTQCQKTRALA
jgi:hypothetical protein